MFFTRLLLSLAILLPAYSFAQAGSYMPVIFDSANAFFNSVAYGLNSNRASQSEAMIPKGLMRLSKEDRFVFWVELEAGRL